jgi:hypothetical protein
MAVFWDVAPCSLVKFSNVSEVLTASTITDDSYILVKEQADQTHKRLHEHKSKMLMTGQ